MKLRTATKKQLEKKLNRVAKSLRCLKPHNKEVTMRSVEGIIQDELENDLIRLGWKHTKGFSWEKNGKEMHYADAVSEELKKIK